MQLSPPQRAFLVEQVVGAAIVNALLNALIGWLAFRSAATVPVWGDRGMAVDLCATALLLPLLLCLISTPLVRRAVRAHPGLTLAQPASAHKLLRFLPANTFLRASCLGVLALLLALPLVVLALKALGNEHVSLLTFVLTKAGFSALLASAVAPLAALPVLADPGFGAATTTPSTERL